MTTLTPHAAPMQTNGVASLLATALFPTHDLSPLYPPNQQRDGKLWAIWYAANDIVMGLDFVDFLWSIGLMPVSRGLLRMATGQGRPDFGLHIIYLPWTSRGADEHTLRRYGIQCRHICGDSRGYYMAVGSHQAKWAVEVLTRTMTGRQPKAWKDKTK